MRPLLFALALLSAPPDTPRMTYPQSRTVDQVDTLHGVDVADPYRWLEEDVRTSEDVAEWVKKQNCVTEDFLRSIPERAEIRAKLASLWDYEKLGTPFRRGDRYYFYRNSGLQNQYVLYVQDDLDSEPQVLIDPNTWSEDGTIALAGLRFSHDGSLLAYGVQESGSDWRTWRVMQTATGELLPDKIERVKYSSVAWKQDNSGLYYGRFPEGDDEEKFQSLNLGHQICYHQLGTPQSDDPVVFAKPDEPEWTFGPEVTDDGRFLLVTASTGTDDRNRLFVRDLTDADGEFFERIDNFEHEWDVVGNDGSLAYVKTDSEATNRRIVTLDLLDPSVPVREVVPESKDALVGVSLVNQQLLCRYLTDAKTRVTIYSKSGEEVRDVAFPGIGSASGFSGLPEHTETFYSFSSFAVAPRTYRLDLTTGESTLLREASVDFDPERYVTRQVFYTSKDGTRVPMFITHRKDITLDGSTPTLLYGYGGFSIPLTPGFSISRLCWLELGGVYAVANLRGGGEYGEAWHKAGTKLHKQRVFDDFIAAAKYLIAEGYTSSDKLAIQGGSNGGLLVGACMTQEPELFAAALPAVGVMDMLRFHLFTAGRFWVDDFGSPEDEAEFKAIYAYSPYHNLKPGTKYPATLVTTADTDDRVVPMHSFKFAARLQACHAGTAPVLIRVETKAGHGAGKPTDKIIDEVADQLSFLYQTLGMRRASE